MMNCPFCKKENVIVFKEKYPNAAFDFLKERHAKCKECGYVLTHDELKKMVKL